MEKKGSNDTKPQERPDEESSKPDKESTKAPDSEQENDYGGIPDRDLKKGLGCG